MTRSLGIATTRRQQTFPNSSLLCSVVAVSIIALCVGCAQVPHVQGEWIGTVVTVKATEAFRTKVHDVAALKIERGPVLKEVAGPGDCVPLLARSSEPFDSVLLPDPNLVGKRVRIKGTMVLAFVELPPAEVNSNQIDVTRRPPDSDEYFIVVDGKIEEIGSEVAAREGPER